MVGPDALSCRWLRLRRGDALLCGDQDRVGVETVCTRETTIIEPGAIGNDNQIEVKREYWYSPQLGVNLVSNLQDPRIGMQNFELSEISVTEPDPKLFKMPSNARLIDLRGSAK